MIGIPIDLHPEFPTNANLILLTECAQADPGLLAKIKGQLTAGKTVVITSGLLRALQDKGLQDIVEARCTDRKILAQQYSGGFGAGNFAALDGGTNRDILFPQIDFLTNDAWSLVRAEAGGNAFPLLLMDRYARGVLYLWTLPENFGDLYALPPEVLGAIKNYVLRGFPVRVDGPSQIALFAYDNNTFIVESFLPGETDVKISVPGDFTRLKNLSTGEIIAGQSPKQSVRGRPEAGTAAVGFGVHLPPHS
jgi:hypothetical protein